MILIDSNIFIQSARMEYRFCFCGGFWHLLKELHNAGQVCSIRAVQQELLAGHDDLAKWIKQLPNSFFLDERQDRNVQARYGNLMNWAVNHPQFNDVAKKQFAQPHADPWLVAYAAVHKMKILTHEKFDPNIRRSIKIPNAADYLNVDCLGLYDFLEEVAENNFNLKQTV